MENATKALIMAAEILIGIMIISIGVYIFNHYGEFSKESTRTMEDTQIAEFNQQFQKYYGNRINSDGKVIPIEANIHDITSLANLAKKTNEENDLLKERGYSNTTEYIQIDLNNYRNIEKYTEKELINLIKKNDLNENSETKYYKCTVCKINENTRKVNYMKFVEI